MGHLQRDCPAKAEKKGTEGPYSSKVSLQGFVLSRGDERKSNAIYREERVGGVWVEVLLDTGSNQTLIQRGLVAGGKAVECEVAVRCAHGDTVRYPLVDMEMEIEGRQWRVHMGISTRGHGDGD